ncbi:phage tail protein [Bosea sp. SSUT16]|uniref:Phage tail protein n=1 Tax=Bosea spartocytisi TaxID=2773451 RepID=A0A927I226_9HYPH|nr:phage tail tube protein [Bosea spartocytisi]MBD3847108.1 phage tail protein [Bosea spartocytisi]MCT4474196.1 phage tail protein [Bosea spartocytisi]
MARPTTIRESKLLIKLGDGNTPETFSAPCGITTKSFNRSAEVNEFNVRDCADPDKPAWVERVKRALSSEITGSGLLARESLDVYEAALASDDPVNVQVVLDYAVGPRTYQGAYLVTALNIGAPEDELVNVEITLQSSGPVEPLP